jgi:hypothetical protein
MDDEPLFVIAPPPAAPSTQPGSNRLGLCLTVAVAVAGVAVGLAIGTVLNHRHGTPATGITATASK